MDVRSLLQRRFVWNGGQWPLLMALVSWRLWWVRKKSVDNPTPVGIRSAVLFRGGSTGYISVDVIANGSAAYVYMPLRNLPHLELARALQEHGQADVIVRLRTGDVAMTATELEVRSVTLSAQKSGIVLP